MLVEEFAQRRRALMDIMGPDSIAILPSSREQVRNRDVYYPFRQNSDFAYLSGFPEPDAVLVLAPGRTEHGEVILFCREKDLEREQWDGYRLGPEGACNQLGFDDAFPISDIDDILPGLLEPCERIYFTVGNDPDFDQRVIGWVSRLRQQARSGKHSPGQIVSLEQHVHEMRLHKSPAELELMRAAADVSAQAHRNAMLLSRPGVGEHELDAAISYEFAKAGMEHAYPPIVGGGANGCILHYTENNQSLVDGDLVLIDAGAEHQCYAADITRTFPVNGRFSPEQRALYEVVLAAQEAAIAEAKIGNHWDEPHIAAVRVLVDGLVDLGLLHGQLETLIEQEAYKPFYMHRTGHWLGMDVHDVGDYKIDEQWRDLEAGMTLTVEPGLYISANLTDVDERWHNIGIRIEDDVLITATGPEVLTANVPKSVDGIEHLMSQNRKSHT